MHMGTAARDLTVGQVFSHDGYLYAVREVHTPLLEGADRWNRAVLVCRDLESHAGRCYVFNWDANQVVSLVGRVPSSEVA